MMSGTARLTLHLSRLKVMAFARPARPAIPAAAALLAPSRHSVTLRTTRRFGAVPPELPRAVRAMASAPAIDVEAKEIDTRVPVTIITGFLGAGKTTLLNYILTGDHGKRIAVVENEFGQIDIDGDLVASKLHGAEDVVLLNNGCLCCSVRGDLVRMLGDLVRTKRERFDHIVIETTGLADPAPIIQTFYLEQVLMDNCRLDGVLTVVDAVNAARHLDEQPADGRLNEALGQVAFADRIVLSKTDLAPPEQSTDLEARLRTINGVAAIRRATRGVVDMNYVLGVGGYDLARVVDELGLELEPVEEEHGHSHDGGECGGCDDPSHDHGHSHAGGTRMRAAAAPPPLNPFAPPPKRHDDAVTSVSLQLPGDLDLDAVNDWLGLLLEERWQDIYRLKGVLAIESFPERYVVQGVHALFEGGIDRMWRDGEVRGSKLVFIGKGLDEDELRQGLQQCLYSGSAATATAAR